MNATSTLLRLTDRKRAAVIAAAIEEFLAAGFEATSMDRIAARAGVSKRTVYNHFPSKEVLFAAILRQLWVLMNATSTLLRLTDRKRAAVIAAAIEEFLAAGFEATSMDRIAARAGVSKRTVYNHFPSKEVLFAAILRQLWDSSDTGEAPAYSNAQPLRAQLLQLLVKKLSLLNNEAFLSLARVAIAAGIHSPERARDMVARMGEREEDLTVWIRAATADGRLKTSDPVFASQQLQGLVKAFAFWPQVTMGQPPLNKQAQKQVAESAADMFLARYA